MFRTMCEGGRDGPSPAAHCRFADTGKSPDGAHLPEMRFLLPPQQVQHRSSPQFPFFLPPVLENRPTCPPSSSLLTPVRKRAAAILLEKVTQSHHLFSTCNERTLGSLRNGPSKVIHLILRAKLLLLQSQNEKPHPRVSCLTGDGCHLTFPAAGYWFRYQSKYG